MWIVATKTPIYHVASAYSAQPSEGEMIRQPPSDLQHATDKLAGFARATWAGGRKSSLMSAAESLWPR